ncbi:LOW QUALITY PROTEIN: hypothetical protein PHMEG_000553 [Phytophthora megakarya]|uniref:Reverse transcriptase Ty1/copia-type domain-containing protein n=1 Tax=Phytophthora megakarya TaxID=4795 RepID=A0A225X2T8_9STRA|nr:LOW QUALITY PROTEIN: hypothetical protein PHMEG_000553 [Phytophthora megakarya]
MPFRNVLPSDVHEFNSGDTCGWVVSDYVIEQLDADTAVLRRGLSDLFIWTFLQNENGMVYKLVKPIYDLKQAASAWNKIIHRVDLRNGLKSCGQINVFMIIAAKIIEEIHDVKKALKKAYKMKELRTSKFILGMEIYHVKNDGTLMIKHTRYIDGIMKQFGQLIFKATYGQPMRSPGTVEERTEIQSKPYRSLIGCLLYIPTCTRPDIAYTGPSRTLGCNIGVRLSECYAMNPTRKHGIMYKKQKNGLKVEVFTDADG